MLFNSAFMLRSRFKPLLVIFAMGMAALPATSARAQCDVYVNASDGDDANDGSRTQPLRSFERAYRNAPAAGRVCVAAGEYYLGEDGDGIRLDIPNKSVTFELGAFAGLTEVRFSEKVFVVDAGSGTITFTAGTANSLVFGSGVLNTELPSAPNQLTFLHTFSIRSGSLNLTGTSARIGSAVGVPGRASPANPSKVAPDSARVSFLGGSVTGNLTYGAAKRTVEIASPSFRLPADLSDHRLEFSGGTATVGQIVLPRGFLSFSGNASVVFSGQVTISESSAPVTGTSTFSGSARFDDELTITSAFAPAGAVLNRGPGSITLAQLALGATSPVFLGTAAIENTGGGSIAIQRLVNGTAWAPDLRNLRGTLRLGISSNRIDLRGALANTSTVELDGAVRLLGYAGLPNALNNTGTIRLNGQSFELAGSALSYLNNGGISGSGSLQISTGVNLTGPGTLPDVLVSAPDVTLAAASIGSLSLPSGSVRLTAARTVISNHLDTTVGSTLRLEGSEVEVRGDLTHAGSLSGAETNLAVGGNVTVEGPLEGIALLTMGGIAPQSLTARISIPALELVGAEVNVTTDLQIDGPLSVGSGSHTLSDQTSASSLLLSGGTLAVPANGHLDLAGGAQLAGGSITLGTSSRLTVAQDLTVGGGSIMGDGSNSLDLGGNLTSTGSGFMVAEAVLSFSGGTHVLDLAQAPILSSLDLYDSTTEIRIVRDVSFSAPFRVEPQRRVVLEAETTLLSDLEMNGGQISNGSTGRLRFAGASSVIRGAGSASLPPLVVDGASVDSQIPTDVTGGLALRQGSLRAGMPMTIAGPTTLSGGTVTVSPESRLRLEGSSSISNSLILDPGAELDLAGDSDLTLATLSMADGILSVSGQSQSVSLPSRIALGEFRVSPGASVVIVTGSTLDVAHTVAIDGNVQTGSSRLNLTPTGSTSLLRVNGTYSGARPVVLTDRSGAAGVTLAGNGTFGHLTLALGSDARNAVYSGSTLLLGGTLRLERGGLDLGGAELAFQGSMAGLALNVADSSPTNGQPDGTRIANGSVNPSGSPFNLTWFGAVRRFYEPGLELGFGPLANLTISVSDALNSPAVFGVRLNAPLAIQGSLALDQGVLLRLEAGDLAASGAVTHRIYGRILGSGSLAVTDAVAIEGSASSEIDGLNINSALSAPTSLTVGSIGSLNVDGATVRILPALRAGGVLVRNSVQLRQGALLLDGRLELGTAGRLDAAGSGITIGRRHALYLGSRAVVTADAASTFVLGAGADEPSIVDGGFVVTTGETRFGLLTPLPRLRVAALPGSASDDVFLSASLTITDHLTVVDGDFLLDRFVLTLRGADWTVDANSAPFDGGSDSISGDFAGDGGDVVLEGPGTVMLGGDLILASANLRMRAAAPLDSVRVVSTGMPRQIVVTNKQFSLERGILDLGLNDLVLEGSSSSVLKVSGGRLLGSALPTLPAQLNGLTDNAQLFPFDDDQYGELVLGAGSAAVVLDASAALDNVRLRGNLRLPDNGRTLTVNRRLAIGRRGSRLITIGDGQLQIGPGAVVVQQGTGMLTHQPGIGGQYDLFYDLHDGSVSGEASGFTGGTFTPGPEYVASLGNVRHLGLLAASGTLLDARESIRVSGGLGVYGGTLRFGAGQLTMGDGSRVVVASLTPTAGARLNSSGGYASQGVVDVSLMQPYGDLTLSEDLIPASASIRSLIVRAGTSADSRVILVAGRTVGTARIELADALDTFNLNGNQFSTTGDLTLAGGVTTSGPLASLSTGGAFRLLSPAIVTGAVTVSSGGSAVIEGQYTGLLIQAASDLEVSGVLGQATALVFTGADQELRLASGPARISALTLSQSPSTPAPTLRLTGASLAVTSSLSLERGVILTGGQSIELPSSPSGTTRAPGSLSHIAGRATRQLQAGATETFTWPLGSPTQYRPITVGFQALLSATTLGVTHADSAPLGRAGLPFSLTDSRTIRDTSPFHWTLSSSVNFAESQAYSVQVQSPVGTTATAGSALITLQDGLLGDWTQAGTPAGTVLEDQILSVSAAGIRGGLEPDASVFTIGSTSSRNPATASLQVIHADATPGREALSLYLNGALGRRLSAGTATPAIALETQGTVSLLAESRNDSGPIAQNNLLLQNGLRAVVVEAPGALIVGSNLPVSVTGPRALLTLAHAASDTGPLEVSIGQATLTMAPGTLTSLGALEAGVVDVQVRVAGGPILAAHRIDLGTVRGQTATLVITGFRNPPAGSTADSGLRILLARADGTLDPGVVTTGVETDPALPEVFTLEGNYPNPFNPSTTLRFNLPREAEVRLTVFDLTGRRVVQRVLGVYPAGAGQTGVFDGSGLPSGVYLYRVEASASGWSEWATGRFVLLK